MLIYHQNYIFAAKMAHLFIKTVVLMLLLMFVLTATSLPNSFRMVPSYFGDPSLTIKARSPQKFDNLGSPLFSSTPSSSKVSASTSRIDRKRAIKIVTDLDDTVKSSGGVRLFGIPLGGIDTQYKRGTFYPGVFQFIFELSTSRVASAKDEAVNKVSVLTARAKEFKAALQLKPNDKTCTSFRNTGKRHGFDDWGIGNVYYGSVREWVFNHLKGIRKLENFGIMLQDDSKLISNDQCDYYFVGDTGEKDEEAGERISATYPSKLKGIFLHAVTSTPDRSTFELPKDRIHNGVPIFYFRTYVGAAAKAFQHNLIDETSLLRVINQAKADLAEIESGVNRASRAVPFGSSVSVPDVKALGVLGMNMNGNMNMRNVNSESTTTTTTTATTTAMGSRPKIRTTGLKLRKHRIVGPPPVFSAGPSPPAVTRRQEIENDISFALSLKRVATERDLDDTLKLMKRV